MGVMTRVWNGFVLRSACSSLREARRVPNAVSLLGYQEPKFVGVRLFFPLPQYSCGEMLYIDVSLGSLPTPSAISVGEEYKSRGTYWLFLGYET